MTSNKMVSCYKFLQYRCKIEIFNKLKHVQTGQVEKYSLQGSYNPSKFFPHANKVALLYMLKKLATYTLSKNFSRPSQKNLAKGTKEGYQYVLENIATYPFLSESVQPVG